jgi:hypothetical protein
MLLSTPSFSALPRLLAVLGLSYGLVGAAAAQSTLRYTFPNTTSCQLQPLPTGEVLMASIGANSPLLRLHWLNGQGDTVRSKRVRLRARGPYILASISLNPVSGAVLLGMSTGSMALLTAQGDTLCNPTATWPTHRRRPLPTPDGGFVCLNDGNPLNPGVGPALVKLNAAGVEVRRTAIPGGAGSSTWAQVLLPAPGGGYWAVVYDSGTTPSRSRAVFVDAAGNPSGQSIPLTDFINLAEPLPDPAEGYIVSGSAGLQRLSTRFAPQWAAPVPPTGYLNHYGLRVAADGTALAYGGPYVSNGTQIPPDPYPVQARVVSERGRILQDTLLAQVRGGRSGFGLDIAKTSAGHLVYAVEHQGNSIYTSELRVYVTHTALSTIEPPAPAPAPDTTQVGVFPQPTTGPVTVRTAVPLLGEATLYNLSGTCVRVFALSGSPTNTLDLTGLPAGLYVLHAVDATGAPVVIRLSKQ